MGRARATWLCLGGAVLIVGGVASGPPEARPQSDSQAARALARHPYRAAGLGQPGQMRPVQLRLGLNFVGFYVGDGRRGAVDTRTPYRQPVWIFDDFRALGVHGFRQAALADLFWDLVEPQDDQWHFTEADSVLPNPWFEPVATLFALQYASPTPPWERDPARVQTTLGREARDYLAQVVARYGAHVRYWELGNEMDHWRAADPGMPPPPPGVRLPLAPPGGFPPRDQGVFLAEAAAVVRERDPGAVIVLPGMSAPVGYPVTGWLDGVLQGGGRDWFDVVNYHYYGPWQEYCRQRLELQEFLDRRGLSNKPVWLTETGATSSSTLTARTNYPNSPAAQAADVFRRVAPAYALGDAFVSWHTYIDSPDLPTNDWRGYGIRTDRGEAKLAYHSLRLLATELLPFETAELVSCDPRGLNAFRFVRPDRRERHVVWGAGSYAVPSGVSEMTSVVPDGEGRFTWRRVSAGQRVQLTDVPVLLR